MSSTILPSTVPTFNAWNTVFTSSRAVRRMCAWTGQRSGRQPIRAKRCSAIACRHRCRRKKPLTSTCWPACTVARVFNRVLRAGRDNVRDKNGDKPVRVSRSVSYTFSPR
jgi:hypothetical protein